MAIFRISKTKPAAIALSFASFFACTAQLPPEPRVGHGPVAQGISSPQGEARPGLDPQEKAAFERGLEVVLHEYKRSEGLGPAFNVTSCVGCHERPAPGGGAGLYRNFFLSGSRLSDDSFIPAKSFGEAGGVVRLYYFGEEDYSRPKFSPLNNVFAQRNPIPFFGVGLLAEIEEDEILSREDPDDDDGDGISGRANWDRGFVGRFGRKSQTVSLEGFVRGPLFNHLGLTSNPLSDELKAKLPVDSQFSQEQEAQAKAVHTLLSGLIPFGQAAAPEVALIDMDDAPDPELSEQELFDIVSYAMLLGAPQLDQLDEAAIRGRNVFDAIGCGDCHTPRVAGPRGPLPLYSDLLLHDMGTDLADGIEQGVAQGNEFRTQPLWGLSSVGPYLHDGRAESIEHAILLHGGEGQEQADFASRLSGEEMRDLVAFLESLGGAGQKRPGLLPADDVPPTPGELGGARNDLTSAELAAFEAGRELFDQEFGLQSGVGSPRFNGDSCRACHFRPTVGGAGPLGVNVMRHAVGGGTPDEVAFVAPAVGTILHKSTRMPNEIVTAQENAETFEHRQTPPLFGLGLIEAIDDSDILANEDPNDLDGDGVSGRASWTDGGRLGRFGWKAQVPSLAEFVRDAVSTELGMTLPYEEGHTFGLLVDNDEVPDPEFAQPQIDLMLAYLSFLSPPPQDSSVANSFGRIVFERIGCDDCHRPYFDTSLDGEYSRAWLFSDLLLHETLPAGSSGIEEAGAGILEFRTPPLWGLQHSAPYMHDGAAESIEDAIIQHDGEAKQSRVRFEELDTKSRSNLLSFLGAI